MTEYRAVYNKRAIMLEAHRFFRDGRFGTFAECLEKAWENAKKYKALAEGIGETVRTWYGWTQVGREVLHGQTTVGQIEVWETLKKRVRTIKSYFTYEQTCELGTQPPKEELV